MSTAGISPVELRSEFRAPEIDPARPLPDHTQLPDSDGEISPNFQEPPQRTLLTDPIVPHLERLRPDGDFCVGRDNGIYWTLTDPPLNGAVSPDWFVVLGVPRSLAGKPRRSYVLWYEHVPPCIILEFVSGDGRAERDSTPQKGKYWIYEQAIGAEYYGIYEVDLDRIEMYRLVNGRYERQTPNAEGRFPIAPLGLELGIWRGTYEGFDLPWMRWWYPDGTLLPTHEELALLANDRAAAEHRRAEAEKVRAEAENQRAERLAAQLRALGIDPDDD